MAILKWAYSSVAERIHGMDQVRVRFPVGPKNNFDISKTSGKI